MYVSYCICTVRPPSYYCTVLTHRPQTVQSARASEAKEASTLLRQPPKTNDRIVHGQPIRTTEHYVYVALFVIGHIAGQKKSHILSRVSKALSARPLSWCIVLFCEVLYSTIPYGIVVNSIILYRGAVYYFSSAFISHLYMLAPATFPHTSASFRYTCTIPTSLYKACTAVLQERLSSIEQSGLEVDVSARTTNGQSTCITISGCDLLQLTALRDDLKRRLRGDLLTVVRAAPSTPEYTETKTASTGAEGEERPVHFFTASGHARLKHAMTYLPKDEDGLVAFVNYDTHLQTITVFGSPEARHGALKVLKDYYTIYNMNDVVIGKSIHVCRHANSPLTPENWKEVTKRINEMKAASRLTDYTCHIRPLRAANTVEYTGPSAGLEQLQTALSQAGFVKTKSSTSTSTSSAGSRKDALSCLTCTDDVSVEDSITCAKCGHVICLDCIKGYFSSSFANIRVPAQLPCACPAAAQPVLSLQVIDRLGFDQNVINQFVALAIQHCVARHKHAGRYTQCPNCSLVLPHSPDPNGTSRMMGCLFCMMHNSEYYDSLFTVFSVLTLDVAINVCPSFHLPFSLLILFHFLQCGAKTASSSVAPPVTTPSA